MFMGDLVLTDTELSAVMKPIDSGCRSPRPTTTQILSCSTCTSVAGDPVRLAEALRAGCTQPDAAGRRRRVASALDLDTGAIDTLGFKGTRTVGCTR
jgi:hypothetical protein